jgi:hypothetical protein
VAALIGDSLAVWRSFQTNSDVVQAELSATLLSLFCFLAGEPLLAASEDDDDLMLGTDDAAAASAAAAAAKASPSVATCLLLEQFPAAMTARVPTFIAAVAPKLSEQGLNLELAVSRMLQWPMSEKLVEWVAAVFQGLCQVFALSFMYTLTP